MKRVIKWIVILGVIGAAVAGIGYSVKMGNIVEVELVSPTRGDLTSYVEETGRIRLDRWHVVTARVAGVCDAVRVDVGDAVREGQVIAEIDDTAYVEGVRQARASILEIQARIDGLRVQLPRDAEVRQAALQTEIARKNLKMETVRGQTLRARLEQTEKDLERFQNLSAEGSYPLAEVDRVKTELATLKDSLTNHANLLKVAQLNVDVALQVQKLLEDRKGDVDHLKKALEAQMAQIQSQIAVLENDRKKAVIAAPFAGVVLERMTKGDTFVQPGTPVIRVGDPASVEVEVDLLTDDLPLIGLGRTSFVSGKALGDVTYEGKVVKIYPEAFTKMSSLGIEQQRVKVIIRLDRANGTLKPGISVDVRIVDKTATEALLIPEKSFFTVKDKRCVFTVQGGKLALREVTLGLMGDEFVQVVQGLAPSAKIVLSPDNQMAEGQETRVKGEAKNGE